MDINELKELALLLLSNYEAAWSENAALHVILDTYPMPDGSKGIPSWREIRDERQNPALAIDSLNYGSESANLCWSQSY